MSSFLSESLLSFFLQSDARALWRLCKTYSMLVHSAMYLGNNPLARRANTDDLLLSIQTTAKYISSGFHGEI